MSASALNIFRSSNMVIARCPSLPSQAILSKLDVLLNTSSRKEYRGLLSALESLWSDPEIRSAIELASPSLSAQIQVAVETGNSENSSLNGLVTAITDYVRRWANRTAPFGFFSGVLDVSIADKMSYTPTESVEVAYSSVVNDNGTGRTDSVCSDTPDWGTVSFVRSGAIIRTGGMIISSQENAMTGKPEMIKVEDNPLLSQIIAATKSPATFDEILGSLDVNFEGIQSETIRSVISSLIRCSVLLVVEHRPAGQSLGVVKNGQVLQKFDQLTGAMKEISYLRRQSNSKYISTSTPSICLDLKLGSKVTIPKSVVRDVEKAASLMAILSPFPCGNPKWRGWSDRFQDIFGANIPIPLGTAVAACGIPAFQKHSHNPLGFAGQLGTRDIEVMKMVQLATREGRREIRLEAEDINRIAHGDDQILTDRRRVEVAFQIHSRSMQEIESGKYQIWITGTPYTSNSMLGRFYKLFGDDNKRRYKDSFYQDELLADQVAQLTFDTTLKRSKHIADTEVVLDSHISLDGLQKKDKRVIEIEDLSVLYRNGTLSLVQHSTMRRILVYACHSVEMGYHTPELPRFLLELSEASSRSFGPFFAGFSRHMDYLPRFSYKKIVLAPARWVIPGDLIRASRAEESKWQRSLDTWVSTWEVPSAVQLVEFEMKMPIDLEQDSDRRFLKSRLRKMRDSLVYLEETGSLDRFAWADRPIEFVMSLCNKQDRPEEIQTFAASKLDDGRQYNFISLQFPHRTDRVFHLRKTQKNNE